MKPTLREIHDSLMQSREWTLYEPPGEILQDRVRTAESLFGILPQTTTWEENREAKQKEV